MAHIRARRLVPIALLFLVYLLNALATTAVVGETAPVVLMTGRANGSMAITFTPKSGVLPELAGKELILVTARNGAIYVVERQPIPPSPRPMSFVVPIGSIEAAQVPRLNAADAIVRPRTGP